MRSFRERSPVEAWTSWSMGFGLVFLTGGSAVCSAGRFWVLEIPAGGVFGERFPRYSQTPSATERVRSRAMALGFE